MEHSLTDQKAATRWWKFMEIEETLKNTPFVELIFEKRKVFRQRRNLILAKVTDFFSSGKEKKNVGVIRRKICSSPEMNCMFTDDKKVNT